MLLKIKIIKQQRYEIDDLKKKENLHDTGFGKCLKYDTKSISNKRKINRLYQNLKCLCFKGYINKVKSLLMEWDKIFANHISDEE